MLKCVRGALRWILSILGETLTISQTTIILTFASLEFFLITSLTVVPARAESQEILEGN